MSTGAISFEDLAETLDEQDEEQAAELLRREAGVIPSGCPTERITVRVPPEELDDIDSYVEDSDYPDRSSFIRSAIRSHMPKGGEN